MNNKNKYKINAVILNINNDNNQGVINITSLVNWIIPIHLPTLVRLFYI